jgi:hypothetical protein
MSGTGVINAAEKNLGRHRDTDSVNNHSVIRDRERIKRILDWHTDAKLAEPYVSAWDLKGVGRKRHNCRGRIQK